MPPAAKGAVKGSSRTWAMRSASSSEADWASVVPAHRLDPQVAEGDQLALAVGIAQAVLDGGVAAQRQGAQVQAEALAARPATRGSGREPARRLWAVASIVTEPASTSDLDRLGVAGEVQRAALSDQVRPRAGWPGSDRETGCIRRRSAARGRCPTGSAPAQS